MRITGKKIRVEQPHVSDEELLLSLDGELPFNRRAPVQKHVEACWECRARLIEMQNAISGFIRVHHAQFDDHLPPLDGPRALLRTQLRQMNAQPKRSLMDAWRGSNMGMGAAAIGILTIGVAAVLAIAFQQRWRADDFKILNNPESAMPRASLTPGETVSVTITSICAADFPTEKTIALPASLKRRVFERYHLSDARPGDFEVDYLIAPDLGGATTVRNLWPEPYSSTVWNARVKDQLETRLKDLVCSGKLDLATAQHDISADWIAAYKKYFQTNLPLNVPRSIAVLLTPVDLPRSGF